MNKTNTSTQIRNMYSGELSYLRMSFFNTNIAFTFTPYKGLNSNGRHEYDKTKALQTTLNYENAYALYQTIYDIILGKIDGEMQMEIPCAAEAFLILERRKEDKDINSYFSIKKSGNKIDFKFDTCKYIKKINGKDEEVILHSGLGVMLKTLDGYLNGINSSRHLDKLTEDFVRSQNNKPNSYGNNNRDSVPVPKQSWENNTQDMSSYSLPQ